MKKVFLFIVLTFVCNNIICGQTLSSNVDVKKLNARANVLAKKFCDCIVMVGTSSNGLSYTDKKKLINEAGNDFYNYYEDPRRMTTTRRNGKERRQPIHAYLNNLLAQSYVKNSVKRRKYEIRCEFFCLDDVVNNWVPIEKPLSDGCKLYYREFKFYQTYRVIDIFNKNPERRNIEYQEKEKKTMIIYAIKKPGTGKLVVRLGDITRSECKDGRK